MSSPEVTPVYGSAGFFRLYFTPPGGRTQDVTFFRGVPTQFGSMTSLDPFGDAAAQFTFPAITIRDKLGTGDLSWLVPWANVDVVHYDSDNVPSGWVWEGFYAAEDVEDVSQGITCKGALFQLDNYLAKPLYPQRPIPYEQLIYDAFDPDKHPGLRTGHLVIEWPDNWDVFVPDPDVNPDEDPLWFLRPWGVTPGDKWTGLTSRSTGGWDPVLTGHVQTLLGVMYTPDGGQWTVRKRPGRIPVLKVRPLLRTPTEDTMEIWAGTHGVRISLSRDFTQSTNIVYGQGQDLAGTSFSGMRVSNDGTTTFYEPFAALPYVYPATPDNPRYLPNIARKETMLQFPQGVDEISARDVAINQIRKFADPGYTGTITLTIDPMRGGLPTSRFLIKAGESIVIHDVRGADLLCHISEANVDIESGTTTLTVDTKFRDAMTIHEVRARTRDALDPVRLLQVGKYSSTVQDLIKPWSYVDGSGVIPSGGGYDATEFFTKLISPTSQFPWTEWTTKYPPKKYPHFYIKIGPKNNNATLNWSGVLRDGIAAAAIPIKMSQSGTIRLTQIAAYDEDGNQIPARFHVGIYGSSGVSPMSMPMVPPGGYDGYAAGQRYPFFPGAFEQYKEDGTEQDQPSYLLAAQSNQVIAWGNYYEPAGYSPGLASAGAPKTGRLVDETAWSFDTTSQPGFDKYSVENTAKNTTAGMLYIMIYCDDQGDQPIYFLGRLFRSEPGA